MKKYKDMDEIEKKEFLIKCMKISLEQEQMKMRLLKELMLPENCDIRKYLKEKYENIHDR